MALGSYDREQRYRKQNGTDRLTGKQRRRIAKKVRHAVANHGLNHDDNASAGARLMRSGSPARREGVMHKLRTDGGTDWDRLHRGELQGELG